MNWVKVEKPGDTRYIPGDIVPAPAWERAARGPGVAHPVLVGIDTNALRVSRLLRAFGSGSGSNVFEAAVAWSTDSVDSATARQVFGFDLSDD